MVVRNDMDRYHLVMDVIDRVPGLARRAASVRQGMADQRLRHHDHIRRTGQDLPEVRDWTWTASPRPAEARGPGPAYPFADPVGEARRDRERRDRQQLGRGDDPLAAVMIPWPPGPWLGIGNTTACLPAPFPGGLAPGGPGWRVLRPSRWS